MASNQIKSGVNQGALGVAAMNAAAEKVLTYRPGMTTDQLKQTAVVYRADGSTPMPSDELPSACALRGEQFDGKELISHRRGSGEIVHLVISGAPLYDASGAISGAAPVRLTTISLTMACSSLAPQ